MAREITDAGGTTWTVAQAYQGLEGLESTTQAAETLAAKKHVYVVCTPAGGAQTVRLKLPPDWESSYSDKQLLAAIDSGRK